MVRIDIVVNWNLRIVGDGSPGVALQCGSDKNDAKCNKNVVYPRKLNTGGANEAHTGY